MEEKLRKKFYINFFMGIILFVIIGGLFIGLSIYLWLRYVKGWQVVFPILFSIFTIGFCVIYTIKFIPIMKDLKQVRRNNFLQAEGIVVGFRKIVYGGEPDTEGFRPIIKDNITKQLVELDVCNEKIYLNKEYVFLYFKNTKIAVFDEKRNLIIND